jgi:hypothetical protein
VSLYLFVQCAIAVLGPLGIWMSQTKSERSRKWAVIVGLAGQPLWLYTAVYAHQWGNLVACSFYTVSWARGVYTYWIKRTP